MNRLLLCENTKAACYILRNQVLALKEDARDGGSLQLCDSQWIYLLRIVLSSLCKVLMSAASKNALILNTCVKDLDNFNECTMAQFGLRFLPLKRCPQAQSKKPTGFLNQRSLNQYDKHTVRAVPLHCDSNVD